jgi:hypothetical protein
MPARRGIKHGQSSEPESQLKGLLLELSKGRQLEARLRVATGAGDPALGEGVYE